MAEQTQAPPPAAPEPADVDVRLVMWVGAALAATVIGCALLTLGLLAWFGRDGAQPASPYSDVGAVRDFAGPRLEPAPARDIAAFKAEKARKLDRYGWIDRGRGIVQIPIERAMELMVERRYDGAKR